LKKIPNLFICGAPKAGTTTMHALLSQHPQIYLTKDKEPHYFCSDFHAEAVKFHGGKKKIFHYKSENEYLNLFEDTGQTQYSGEASVTYFFSKLAAKNIYDFNKRSKIIIILRKPIEMAYSWYNYLYARGLEDLESFQEALDKEDFRKRTPRLIHKNALYPSSVYYSDLMKIDQHVKRFLDLFPRENIYFLLFDDIKKDAEKSYGKVLEFLNLQNDTEIEVELLNKGAQVRNIQLKRVIDSQLKNMQRALLPHREHVIVKAMHKLYTSLFFNQSSYKKEDLDNIKLNLDLNDIIVRTEKLIVMDLLKRWEKDHIIKA